MRYLDKTSPHYLEELLPPKITGRQFAMPAPKTK